MIPLFLTSITTAEPHFPVSATLLYIIGFIAATTLGSIAWYNSKRPPGWEGKDRPESVPELDKDNPLVGGPDA